MKIEANDCNNLTLYFEQVCAPFETLDLATGYFNFYEILSARRNNQISRLMARQISQTFRFKISCRCIYIYIYSNRSINWRFLKTFSRKSNGCHEFIFVKGWLPLMATLSLLRYPPLSQNDEKRLFK